MDLKDFEGNKLQREPEVTSQMNQLEKEISILGEFISTLRTRFQLVLKVRPCGEEKIGEEKIEKTKEELVPLARTIRQFRIRLQEYTGAIREMSETCEL